MEELRGWTVRGGKLYKEFRFSSFNEAFGFMTRAALEIEKIDHHPEWCNVYNMITIRLTTHDAGGITTKDISLARTLDLLVSAE